MNSDRSASAGPEVQTHRGQKYQVIIVGYGHAGRIHRKAYDAVANLCTVAAVVDPDLGKHAEISASLPGAKIYRELAEALLQVSGEVVVDFCVPAKVHLELVETALGLGVNRFLIEKPLAWDLVSSQKLVAKLHGCEVVYLDTYAASTGVRQLLEKITRQNSAVEDLKLVFHKNRIGESRLGRGFAEDAVPSAWMIEGPHMLSIAMQVAGQIAHVSSASTFDMELGQNQLLPGHGGGRALLEHENGAITRLDLDLCSDHNVRKIEVKLRNGVQMTVDLPPSKAERQCSVLHVVYSDGAREVHQYEDRPIENCVQNAISHLAGERVAVGSMAGGLAICIMVERMTERTKFWQSVPKQWKHFGPPLRPSPEDIRVMEQQVADWMGSSSSGRCDVLLCGVTPEIASMHWPAGTRLWAVEKSLAMIREVWPAGDSLLKQAVQGEWTCLPFSPGSFDIVIGDGCLTSLNYPQQQAHFLQALRAVLRSKGMLIMRHFVQADEPEQPESVFADLRAGRIGSFHAFKWRLAMSLQESASNGVRVDDIWRKWTDAKVATAWPGEAVDTIGTYRGSDHRLTFTTLQEVRDLHAGLFAELHCITQGYELAERCPIMVFVAR
ncbi:MAG TPA: Gfo/Idh/MocA family oxidoreductase [Xanthomonadales bacterium]|nr:Gfo/Idh/MocA family oxidoreductase [Xanthomonadales bacterium]